MKYGLLLLLMMAGLAGCRVKTETESDTPKIVCSTSIIRDCIQQIVGDSIEVTSLMGPGIDPHAYNPRPSDIALLNNATVVVYNGLHLEGKMVELFEQLGKRKTVLAVSGSIPKNELILADPSAGTFDPHIWFDTKIWLQGLEGVVEQLCKKYPKHATAFKANFERFKTTVTMLQLELKLQLATIPAEQRVLITSHDAFHYFGRSFDVNVKALQGISTTQEPGVRDVIDLVSFITENKVKALFVEHSVSPKAIRTVIESCSRKGQRVRIGGTLYSDALGDPTSTGGTYIGMLRHNVTTIVQGLK